MAVIDWDLSFKVNSWNKSAEKIFGFTKNEAIGRHASELIVPSDLKDQINKVWFDLIKNKGGNRSINENITKDGKTITCDWYNTPLVNEQDKVIGVTSFVLDITEQKKAEQSLKESESRYRTIIENISDGLIIVNYEGEFLSVNSAYCKMHGYSIEEMLNIKSQDIVHPNYSDVFEKFKESLQEKGFFEGEVIDIHKNGSLVYVYIRGKSFNYADKQAILVIVSDITKQKEMDKAMLNAVIKTEEKERSRIAKDLHDGLGPILSTIKLYNQWIQNPDKKTSHEYIFDNSTDAIEEAIKSIKEISNNLSPHVLTNYGIASAIKSFIDKLTVLYKTEIVFETNLTEKLKNPIIETTLYRIFTECINNTHKYAKADKIQISLNQHENNIEMEYSDNGIGFDVKNELKNPRGLGLNNIINRVRTINGQYSISSNKKTGTKISVKIMLNN